MNKIDLGGIDVMSPNVISNKNSRKKVGARAESTKNDTSPIEKRFTPTIEQMRAVEAAQNAHRGRGPKQGRKPVRFEADCNLVEEIEELHYKLGRTKHELYNEAFRLLIRKYARKRNR